MTEHSRGADLSVRSRAAIHAALDALLDALQAQEPSPYYDQDSSPLGPKRHRDAINSGKLRGFRHGHQLLARREDVHAFIESSPVETPTGERSGLASARDAERLLRRIG